MSRTRLLASLILILVAITWGCQEYAEPTLTPGQKKKVEAHLLTEAPTPQHKIGAVIEDQVRLIGYDIDKTTAKLGDTVTITYYLEALSEKMGDNKLFVHFQGRKNDPKAWMNLDHHPIEGLWPLRKLKKGQIVKDVQTFRIREDFPDAEAKVYWGLWRGDYRLKINNAEDVPHDPDGRVIVATIKLEGVPAKAPAARPRLPMAVATILGADDKITVDGALDEPVWQRTSWTAEWTSPDGKNRPVPKTRARFAFDQDMLYVAVEAEDDDIWGTLTERDSDTWTQEVIELFIDADGDRKDYLELQVTPANIVFDARFEAHRSDLSKARAWNMAGFKSAVKIEGTLNARDDKDTRWTVEMAVPVSQVPGAKPLAHGQTWRVNLFRWDFPKGERQRAAAFSPPIVPDFHALDRFGRLRFVDPAKVSRLPVRKAPVSPQTLKLKPVKAEMKLPTPPGQRPAATPAAQPGGGQTPAPAAEKGSEAAAPAGGAK